MIKIVAKFTLKEDKIDEFKSLASELVTETRREDGCISYRLFQEMNNVKVLTFIEEWENQNALDRHMQSKHFKEILPKLAETQEKDADISIYQLVL